ncbi:MAG TPA: hypothetical protein VMY05_00350 [Acidobacteriota bacterium]|nr:hypothetical protein [Acidobacteriota bacterium]
MRAIALLATPVVCCLLLLGCAAGPGVTPGEKNAPVERPIHASFGEVYRAVASVLAEYNFPFQHTDETLGIIRTEFTEYKAGAKGFWAGLFAGWKDFRMQINAQVSAESDSTSLLHLYGKMKYKESGLFKDKEREENIRVGSDSYRQMEEIAELIKERAEGTDPSSN